MEDGSEGSKPHESGPPTAPAPALDGCPAPEEPPKEGEKRDTGEEVQLPEEAAGDEHEVRSNSACVTCLRAHPPDTLCALQEDMHDTGPRGDEATKGNEQEATDQEGTVPNADPPTDPQPPRGIPMGERLVCLIPLKIKDGGRYCWLLSRAAENTTGSDVLHSYACVPHVDGQFLVQGGDTEVLQLGLPSKPADLAHFGQATVILGPGNLLTEWGTVRPAPVQRPFACRLTSQCSTCRAKAGSSLSGTARRGTACSLASRSAWASLPMTSSVVTAAR